MAVLLCWRLAGKGKGRSLYPSCLPETFSALNRCSGEPRVALKAEWPEGSTAHRRITGSNEAYRAESILRSRLDDVIRSCMPCPFRPISSQLTCSISPREPKETKTRAEEETLGPKTLSCKRDRLFAFGAASLRRRQGGQATGIASRRRALCCVPRGRRVGRVQHLAVLICPGDENSGASISTFTAVCCVEVPLKRCAIWSEMQWKKQTAKLQNYGVHPCFATNSIYERWARPQLASFCSETLLTQELVA